MFSLYTKCSHILFFSIQNGPTYCVPHYAKGPQTLYFTYSNIYLKSLYQTLCHGSHIKCDVQSTSHIIQSSPIRYDHPSKLAEQSDWKLFRAGEQYLWWALTFLHVWSLLILLVVSLGNIPKGIVGCEEHSRWQTASVNK